MALTKMMYLCYYDFMPHEFNINDQATVTITDVGRRILQKTFPPDYLLHCLPGWDTTGVIETQFWSLMNTFGGNDILAAITKIIVSDSSYFLPGDKPKYEAFEVDMHDSITVRLTEKGIIILRDALFNAGFHEEQTKLYEHLADVERNNGVIKMRFWCLCVIFGRALSMGFDIPFETTVTLERGGYLLAGK